MSFYDGEPTAPAEINNYEPLQNYKFEISFADGLGVESLEFPEEEKAIAMMAVLNALKGLPLDPNLKKVHFHVDKVVKPSVLISEDSHVDLQGRIMVFTLEGPKHFNYTFPVLDESMNAVSGEIKEASSGILIKIRERVRKLFA